MTTEDDFQNALDAHPEDWQTRLVFADWLEENGDPRAEGYRALGVLRRRPFRGDQSTFWTHWGLSLSLNVVLRNGTQSCLVGDWESRCGERYNSRRAAEDAAARAFATLPAERRAELLTGALS